MPSAFVFDRPLKGPATHAVIIGIGSYPHLPGGSSRAKTAHHEGMGQLTSPPQSARHLARWLIDQFDSPARPLGSVQLLISEKKPRPFPLRGAVGERTSVTVPRATKAEIERALADWRSKGDSHSDNLMLLFFCGHGAGSGLTLSLLLEDFGDRPNAPLKNCIDLRRFHSAMDECAARDQCYFIDACRTESRLLTANAGFAGDPIFQSTGIFQHRDRRARAGPMFFSTVADAAAYSRPGKPSIFTDAVIAALSGAGSGDSNGPWEVTATRLQTALDAIMREESQALGLERSQTPSADAVVELTLNTVAAPQVPIFVRVEPAAAHAIAKLRCEGPECHRRLKPSAEPWRFQARTGVYDFVAEFKTGCYKHTALRKEPVRPPFWRKPILVGP